MYHPAYFQQKSPIDNKYNKIYNDDIEKFENNTDKTLLSNHPEYKIDKYTYTKSYNLTSNDNYNSESSTKHLFKNTYGETPLTFLFFSDKNIRNIQNLIKYTVFNNTGFLIDDQNNMELNIVMRSMFIQYNNHPKLFTDDMSDDIKYNLIEQYKKEVIRLNEFVVNEVVPGIVSQLVQYIKYIKDINENKLDKYNLKPVNTNIKGEREYRSITSVLTGSGF